MGKRLYTGDGKRLYNSKRWHTLRLRVLAHEPACRDCARKDVLTAATTVDHIQPHRNDLKLFWDESNLQALCSSCHSKKTARETRAVSLIPQVEKPKCRVLLVCGPAGSGKSTLVRERASPGDLVVDMDALAVKLTGRPEHSQLTNDELRLTLVERNRILFDLHKLDKSRTAWVIVQAPRWHDRRQWKQVLGCETIVLETAPDLCVERCEGRPPGTDWQRLVSEWYSCYSSGWDDEVIRG